MFHDDSSIDDLLDRAAAGDDVARDYLLVRHRSRLKRMVQVRMDQSLRARVDPSDIVQDALLEASQRLADYLQTRPLPFYPWLRHLAWRRLTDAFRRHVQSQKRSVRREHFWSLGLPHDSAFTLSGILAASQSSPSTPVVRQELQNLMHDALSTLPNHDREVLVMCYLERMSFAEIAAVLEMTESGVKSRHRRALLKLRHVLDGHM